MPASSWQLEHTDFLGTGPRPVEHDSSPTRLTLVTPCNVTHYVPSRTGAEYRDGPATATTGDLCAEQPALGPDVQNELHEQIGSITSQPTCTVTGVRVQHELTHFP